MELVLIKQSSEDFIVEELLATYIPLHMNVHEASREKVSLDQTHIDKTQQKNTLTSRNEHTTHVHFGEQTSVQSKSMIFRLKKTQLNTLDALFEVAKFLHIDKKMIGFAGLKDKHAQTTQYISIPTKPELTAYTSGVRMIIDKPTVSLSIEFMGYSSHHIRLGDLEANVFTIIARDAQLTPKPVKYMLNFYGEQRFSSHNVLVGRAIVKKLFADACTILKNQQQPSIITHLEKSPNDYIGALNRIEPRLLTLFIHAYQSYLWNRTVSFMVQQTCPLCTYDYKHAITLFETEKQLEKFSHCFPKIPLIGFFYEESDWPQEIRTSVEHILKEEHISPRDFIIKSLPKLTKSGDFRESVIPVEQCSVTPLENEKKAYKVSFALQSSSYATVALRHIFLHEDVISQTENERKTHAESTGFLENDKK